MPEKEIIQVDINSKTICCDGDEDGLGHPAVYFTFGDQNTVTCNYCGRIFNKKES